MTTPLNSVNFAATYPMQKIKEQKRFILLCVSNPVGWVVGGLYLIQELFKRIVLHFGRPSLFGSNLSRLCRNTNLIDRLKELGGEPLKLQSPDRRILEALYCPAAKKVALSKTILFFSGSASSYEFHAFSAVKAYQKKGYNVLCMNYGGFGKSEGTTSQSTLELDAETAYQYVSSRDPTHEIYAHGYSLGSYPASYLAKTHGLKKVVLDRGFSRFPNVVEDITSRSYGKAVQKILKLLTACVCPLNNLRNVKAAGKTKFLHARASHDLTMSSYHADLIQKQAPSRVTVLDFIGGHLNNFNSAWFKNNEPLWEWLKN